MVFDVFDERRAGVLAGEGSSAVRFEGMENKKSASVMIAQATDVLALIVFRTPAINCELEQVSYEEPDYDDAERNSKYPCY